jgi:hypothetical protein
LQFKKQNPNLYFFSSKEAFAPSSHIMADILELISLSKGRKKWQRFTLLHNAYFDID